MLYLLTILNKVVYNCEMENKTKNPRASTTPAWHIGAQAFIALLILLIVPLAINIKSVVTTIMSKNFASKEPKKFVVEKQPETKKTLTRFLAAAVFGVDPDTNVYVDPNTGKEIITLPYGGTLDTGGDIQTDKWIGEGPHTDGTAPVIYKYQYALPNYSNSPINTGGSLGTSGNLNAGGKINSGGTISAGGTIPAGGKI